MTVTTKIFAADDLTTVIATLTAPTVESWSDVLNDVGSGSFRLQADDSQLSACTLGRVAQFLVDGTAAFSFVIDHRVRQTVPKPGEEDEGKTVVLSGDGLAQLFNRAVVKPTLGYGKTPWAKSRTFSFASPEFDASAWTVPTVIVPTVASTSFGYTGSPAGFWSLNETWIGPSSGDDTQAPYGYWYTVYDFTLVADTLLIFGAAADDNALLFFDGFLLGKIDPSTDPTSGYRTTHIAVVYATAGAHRFAAKVVNNFGFGDPGFGAGATVAGNPSALVMTCWEAESGGKLVGRLFGTSDYADWLILEYPASAPGMTVGQIQRLLITEAQADGLIPGITTDFTDTLDTASNAFDTLEAVTVNVGDNLLNVLRTFAGAYCDWAIAPDSLTLSMWRFGERGTARTVTYNATNLTGLEYDTIDAGIDALLVSWSGGQFRYPTSGGDRLTPLSLDSATINEAKALAAQQLALFGGNRVQITAQIEPAGSSDQPYTGYLVGDTGITVPGETSGTTSQRVVQIDCSVDDVGVPVWSPKLGDVHLTDQARLALNMQKFAGGAVGGYSTVASPAGPPPVFGSKLSASEITFHFQGVLRLSVSPARKRPSASANLYAFALTIPSNITTTSDTTVDLWVNGSVVGSGTIAAGAHFLLVAVDPIIWLEGNSTEVWPEITAAAPEAIDLLVEPRVM